MTKYEAHEIFSMILNDYIMDEYIITTLDKNQNSKIHTMCEPLCRQDVRKIKSNKGNWFTVNVSTLCVNELEFDKYLSSLDNQDEIQVIKMVDSKLNLRGLTYSFRVQEKTEAEPLKMLLKILGY